MLATAIIDKKRDSFELSRDEIQFMVSGITDGTVPDYQIAAWAMAVLCRGMSEQETACLTDCMLSSGRQLVRATERPRVDKHSTGGLGDKVSLILAPLLSCFEVDVPMLSGRGLGITGGTLDKLESYAGYRCDLSETEITQQLQSLGCVITGTTPDIAPADRKLYALRDVTGTVPSIALITASIMSKKLAASLDALVLDVKCGSAAFMRSLADAQQLSASLVATGQRMQVPTLALISNMNQPLGRMVGNACEANEAVDVLSGNTCRVPAIARVHELALRLCSELLVAVKCYPDVNQAVRACEAAISDGRALEKFERLVVAQGGRYAQRLELAQSHMIEAAQSGWIASMNGQQIGRAVIALGGGRQRQGEAIDHRVGVEMQVEVGDHVERGSRLSRSLVIALIGSLPHEYCWIAPLRLAKKPVNHCHCG
ncbi:MAG: thymidine phosphorylase [Pirellulaceae bacterium]